MGFELCRRHVDAVVTLADDALRAAMRLMLDGPKLLLEPAGAAALAALLGPYRARLAGSRVGVIVCGSNIDLGSFARLVGEGAGDANLAR